MGSLEEERSLLEDGLIQQALVGEGSGEEQLFFSENSLMRDSISNELGGYLRKLKEQYRVVYSYPEVGASPRVHRFQMRRFGRPPQTNIGTEVQHVRSLVEDIRNVRFHKIEINLEEIQGRAHAVKIKNLSAMEVNIVRPFVVRALQAPASS